MVAFIVPDLLFLDKGVYLKTWTITHDFKLVMEMVPGTLLGWAKAGNSVLVPPVSYSLRWQF